MSVVGVGQITLFDQNDSPLPFLSNEAHTVPSAADGSSPNLSGAISTFSVILAGVNITNLYAVTATPSSGITGSFASYTYTVSSMTVDVGYVDFSASRAGFATLTKRFSLSKMKQGAQGIPGTNGQDAPRCRGLFAYNTSPASPIFGDLVVWYSPTQAYRGIYAYSGSAWSKVTAPTQDQVTRCFLYILDAVRLGYGTSTDYAIGSTAFETIFTKFMFALQVVLDASGWLQSSQYAVDTEGFPSAGFILDALNNTINAYGSRFTQAIIKNALIQNASFSGVLETDELQTVRNYNLTFVRAGGFYGYELANTFNLIASSSFTPVSGTFNAKAIAGLRNTGALYNNGDGTKSPGWEIKYSDTTTEIITSSNYYNYTNTNVVLAQGPAVYLKAPTSVAGDLAVSGSPSFAGSLGNLIQYTGKISNSSGSLGAITIGKIGLGAYYVSTANSDYSIALPSGGTYSGIFLHSGSYYASVNTKSSDCGGFVNASGGSVYVIANKGGSGTTVGFFIYWRTS